MKNIQLEHNDHKTKNKKYPLCYLAHDIDVSMNIGNFFRIADALGVEKIYLTGKSTVPPNSKIKKRSISTEKFVDYLDEEDPKTVISILRNSGYKIISLEITTQSIDIQNLNLSNDDKICLIFGFENVGICQELLDISDISIHIPMLGINSSVNVANACSIATYEITKRLEK